MNFEYILLLLLTILPVIYKYGFWLYAIQLKEYRWDRFREYISTPQGKSALCNFWFFIELPVYIIGLYVFINPPFEIVIYNLYFYLLLFINIFTLGKLLRKRIILPKFTGRLITTALLLIIGSFLDILYMIHFNTSSIIYLWISILLLGAPLVIFFVNLLLLPVVIFFKNRKIHQAKKISISTKKVIKIGITGSYGKSSIKEFLACILEKDSKTLKTPDNINSELGVTNFIIKNLKNKYKYFVAEMGAYRIGEIKTLGEIVHHKHGFLTAIGNQHLGLFGGIHNTVTAKTEIITSILKNKGILYANLDNHEIQRIKFPKKLKVVTYGKNKSALARYKILGLEDGFTKFTFTYNGSQSTFYTNLIGEHNILNLTGVIACVLDLGLKDQDLKKYVKHLKLPENTQEIIKIKKYNLINDTYNLSENSLFSGLEVLKSFKGEKILVLDDILELGKKSKEIHFTIGKIIAQDYKIDKILYSGVNYEKEFVQGLKKGGFNIESGLIQSIPENNTKTNILFEGKGSKIYLDRLKEKNV